MKFTLSWLKDYLNTNSEIAKISDTLTNIGLEVEKISDRTEELHQQCPSTERGVCGGCRGALHLQHHLWAGWFVRCRNRL